MSNKDKQLSKACTHNPGDDWAEGCCTSAVVKLDGEQPRSSTSSSKISGPNNSSKVSEDTCAESHSQHMVQG
ncbi:hypothetical protein NIES2135_68040 (plasmid) [Leptolyngbya boryana NIES-2135]|jgi:hypothetical protein|uniref:Uncharacterized protein n=1 Tax=Leptolyngbya boryana NIES-2135 TaxID=1973484 RepID=A0A1Z4JT98_LEPBY|nr:hypothetical protein NIES2135_68040 [Leptolyngbya boryana NIES-2135]